MREVVLEVPRADVEAVLDRLLPVLPGGVLERELGDVVELRLRGRELPSLDEIVSLTDQRDLRAWEHQVPDDWRRRRVADYVPDVIGGRLVVAPDWAPASGAEIEIILDESGAFGLGTHPTTRRCLELLLETRPSGSFVDLGCGTGVLAILAARIGFDPVFAVDLSPESVEATQRNARANEVSLHARVLDLKSEEPPRADAFAANVPPVVHQRLAECLPVSAPGLGVVSGFHAGEAEAVLSGYRGTGARVDVRDDVHGWTVAVLSWPLPERRR